MAISKREVKEKFISSQIIREDGGVNYHMLSRHLDLETYESVGEVLIKNLFPKKGIDFNIKIDGNPQLKDDEKLVKKTLSVCPECRSLVRAILFEYDNKIWLRKFCPDHGEQVEIYWGDAEFYFKKADEAGEGRGIDNPYVEITNACPFNCGLCARHRSHTALLNLAITNRCHLGCWYCLPSDEEALFRKGKEVGIYKIIDIAKDCRFDFKVNVGGIRGEYAVPEDLHVPIYQDGYITWSRVTKVFRRVYKGKLLKILTKTGREFRLTPDHKVFVLGEYELKKLSAGELNIGDKLIIMRNIESLLYNVNTIEHMDLIKMFRSIPKEDIKKIYTHNIKEFGEDMVPKLREQFKNAVYWWKSQKYLPLDTYYYSGLSVPVELGRDATTYRVSSILRLSPEFGKLIGYFVADGHYTYKDIRITTNKKEVEKDIITILNKLGYPHSIIKAENRSKQIVVGSRTIRLIFKHVLKIPSKSYKKRLPYNFLSYPEDVKIAILSGLFNGDGYVVRGERHLNIGYASVSRSLIRDILYLLAEFDIFARVYRVSKEKVKGAKHDLYKIYIAGKDMVKLIKLLDLLPHHLNKLGDVGKRKEPKIDKFGDFFIDEIKMITSEDYSGYVYDIEVESDGHNFIVSDGVLVSNCFFYAEAAGYVYEPTLTHIKFMLASARKQQPIPATAVQITGGEPTMRDDIVDIVKIAKELGYTHVQVNTTGIRFIEKPELARSLREAGVNTLYMSFDGVTPITNPKNHWEVPFIFDILRNVGLGIVLVPTVIRSVNLHEVGDMVKFGLKHNDIVRGVNFQPISLVGRVPRKERDRLRVTIPDVIKEIENQTDGQICMDDWYSVPFTIPISRFVEALTGKHQFTMTNHFACGEATYVVQDRRTGRITPIPRFIMVNELMDYLTELTEYLNKGGSKKLTILKLIMKLSRFIDWDSTPEQLRKRKRILRILFKIFARHDYSAIGEFHLNSLFLGMMHFMDEYNYDVARIERCDIHYVTPDGRVVPFCTFNVFPQIYRDKAQKAYSISIREYLKKFNMRSLSAERYRRNIKDLESNRLYRETYAGFWDPDKLSYEEKKKISMRFGVPVVDN